MSRALVKAGDVSQADIEGVVVCGHAPVDVALLEKLPSLKVVSNYGVGVDHIDRVACRQRGIPVGNTPDVLSDAVSAVSAAARATLPPAPSKVAARKVPTAVAIASCASASVAPGWRSFLRTLEGGVPLEMDQCES